MLFLLAVLRFAISSPLGEEQAHKDAAQVSALLTRVLQQEVTAEVVAHDELPLLLSQGKIDLAWLSSSQYVRASPAVPVAKLLPRRPPFYRSAILARERSVQQLGEPTGQRRSF